MAINRNLMGRYVITPRDANLAEIVANSHLYINKAKAEGAMKEGDKIFRVSFLLGTHPELADLPHAILLRDEKLVEKVKESQRLYPNLAETTVSYNHLLAKGIFASIYSLGSLTNLKTGEAFYDADSIFYERFVKKMEAKRNRK